MADKHGTYDPLGGYVRYASGGWQFIISEPFAKWWDQIGHSNIDLRAKNSLRALPSKLVEDAILVISPYGSVVKNRFGLPAPAPAPAEQEQPQEATRASIAEEDRVTITKDARQAARTGYVAGAVHAAVMHAFGLPPAEIQGGAGGAYCLKANVLGTPVSIIVQAQED